MRDKNSFNKVILVGHLGADPEVRYIPQSNRAVANYSLATNESIFNPQTKESEDRTEWHRIVSWGKTAEFCEKYLSKGKQILIEGRLRTDKWEDRNGNQRYTTKIHAYQVTLLGKRGDTQNMQSPPDFGKDSDSSFPSGSGNSMPDTDNEDDDVPF
ncbi:MAG: single-stranded DNA-binding protein [Candidatus Aminicenantes bacterium]|nr:single-stranded DNA-binding protein [Candidatus Aminicenantes bacterium]